MRKVRLFVAAMVLGASSLMIAAAPAGASTCGLPKTACLVYYRVCQVGYDADLFHCID